MGILIILNDTFMLFSAYFTLLARQTFNLKEQNPSTNSYKIAKFKQAFNKLILISWSAN